VAAGSGLGGRVGVPGEVEGPVGVEVAVGDQGAQLDDGFGAVQAPAGAGDVESVADQVPARPLDHAGGDRAAGCQGGLIALSGDVGYRVTLNRRWVTFGLSMTSRRSS
jgi:hypothetical protein